MTKAFAEISEALHDAIAHSKGQDVGVVEHQQTAIDVKAIRTKTGMSQQLFSATFGISVGTLRHWEQGARLPKGPARVLLQVVERNPNAVIEAISNKNVTRR